MNQTTPPNVAGTLSNEPLNIHGPRLWLQIPVHLLITLGLYFLLNRWVSFSLPADVTGSPQFDRFALVSHKFSFLGPALLIALLVLLLVKETWRQTPFASEPGEWFILIGAAWSIVFASGIVIVNELILIERVVDIKGIGFDLLLHYRGIVLVLADLVAFVIAGLATNVVRSQRRWLANFAIEFLTLGFLAYQHWGMVDFPANSAVTAVDVWTNPALLGAILISSSGLALINTLIDHFQGRSYSWLHYVGILGFIAFRCGLLLL